MAAPTIKNRKESGKRPPFPCPDFEEGELEKALSYLENSSYSQEEVVLSVWIKDARGDKKLRPMIDQLLETDKNGVFRHYAYRSFVDGPLDISREDKAILFAMSPFPGCPICMLYYEKSSVIPTIGACGHTLCNGCREKLRSTSCPTCNNEGSFAKLAVNYELLNMVTKLREVLAQMNVNEPIERSTDVSEGIVMCNVNGTKAVERKKESSDEKGSSVMAVSLLEEPEQQILEEVNVLVLGETGVGKSTWINAIANYLTYENIEEASQKNLINLIPTEFTISVKKDNVMTKVAVKVGSSENEKTDTTSSCTQHPRSYVFTHNRKNYRIIDTPGIGDTRGMDKDQENIRNIIRYIAKYERIHAICILLLPNQARLTAPFEFCFKEIIMQFHRSAAANIVFCFTNTSGCGFCVGETHMPLEKLISEIGRDQDVKIELTGETMYPFDNMAYRYLCAKKTQNAEFSKVLETLYQQSFIASRDETLRLFERISTLTPHKTEDSVTLKYVRQVIDKLTKPLAKINTMVTDVLGEIEDKATDIEKNQNNKAKLAETLMIKIKLSHYEIRRDTVEYCKMCAVEEEYRGKDRDQYFACDPTLADVDPLKLTVMTVIASGDDCANCGNRDNITSTSKRFVRVTEDKEEEDLNQRSRINSAQDLIDIANEQLAEMTQLKEELEKEHRQIQMAAAKFAYFLRKNSITIYNDATEKYLKLLINLAEKKKNNEKQVENLRMQLDQYMEQCKAFRSQMMGADNVMRDVTHQDVMQEAQSLRNMKHYGRDVAAALEDAQDVTNNVTAEELYFSPRTGLLKAYRSAYGAASGAAKKMSKLNRWWGGKQ